MGMLARACVHASQLRPNGLVVAPCKGQSSTTCKHKVNTLTKNPSLRPHPPLQPYTFSRNCILDIIFHWTHCTTACSPLPVGILLIACAFSVPSPRPTELENKRDNVDHVAFAAFL